MKKSQIYIRCGKKFCYDYENETVMWMFKAGEQEFKENEEWNKKFGKNLWNTDLEGYCVIRSKDLPKKSWTNKEVRDGFLDIWLESIQEEFNRIIQRR